MPAKRRRLLSHVLPVLMYGSECWNETLKDRDRMEVFLNKCRLRLCGARRIQEGGDTLTNENLHRMLPLPSVSELIAKRRLKFLSGIVAGGECRLTRLALFAEAQHKGPKPNSGRVKQCLLKRLPIDCKAILHNTNAGMDLFEDLTSLWTAMRGGKYK